MPRVVYVSPKGIVREIDVPAGTTVMAAALNNGIDGIVAECCGNCQCATCHVYVDEDADLDMAVTIAVNAKTQRVSVCNAAETLLVHASPSRRALRPFGVQGDAPDRPVGGEDGVGCVQEHCECKAEAFSGPPLFATPPLPDGSFF